jgi:hypothetical protein
MSGHSPGSRVVSPPAARCHATTIKYEDPSATRQTEFAVTDYKNVTDRTATPTGERKTFS